jgi:hypothetical protein
MAPPRAIRSAPPVTLTGDAAREFLERVALRAEKLRAEEVAAAKAEASKRGKEPFDLATLETLCDTSVDGSLPPLDQRQREHEWMYYVHYRELTTLAAYAETVDEVNRW